MVWKWLDDWDGTVHVMAFISAFIVSNLLILFGTSLVSFVSWYNYFPELVSWETLRVVIGLSVIFFGFFELKWWFG